jgi:CheY-like chemotaxis protein
VLRQRVILVVEDNLDLRQMMAFALELSGISVVTATNGIEACQQARAHQPSLILLDLMMPVMGGEEFRRTQLADMLISGIPVVVISAHPHAETIALRMEAAGCLTKPIDFGALDDVIRRFV